MSPRQEPFSPIRIRNEVMSAKLIPYGATLLDLRLAHVEHPLILGFEDPIDYKRHQHFYCGAVIGRFANRIGQGACKVDGVPIQLERNNHPNHLHGGSQGFASQCWRIVEQDDNAVEFILESPDGDENYPGDLSISARYQICNVATLKLSVTARTNRTSPINIAHHPYFNLDGGADILDHQLQIAAENYLPCDENLLPTGEISPVSDCAFDFRSERSIRSPQTEQTSVYNNTFCLNQKTNSQVQFAARLTGKSKIEMEVWTTQAGIHFYDGYKLGHCPSGLDGRRYGPRSGLCLEAQNWPDSPNHAHFPNALLSPGETYHQVTEYRFSERG